MNKRNDNNESIITNKSFEERTKELFLNRNEFEYSGCATKSNIDDIVYDYDTKGIVI